MASLKTDTAWVIGKSQALLISRTIQLPNRYHRLGTMQALQPLEPPKSRRTRKRRSPKPPTSPHQELATEIKIKVVANVILSIAAIAAIFRLLPYQFAQQAKLQEVHQDVQEVEGRVNRLRDNFSRNFDPNQMRKIMQEQSPFIDPNQRRVFFK